MIEASVRPGFLSERTRDGLDAARARGRTGGQKPKLTPRQAKIAQDMYDELGPDGRRAHTVQQIADEFGVTRPTIYRHHPAVPRRAKVALLIAIVWVLSPIDLLPEFLPIIGPLDDVVAVVLLLRYAARAIPRDVRLTAWPAERRLLERLLPTAS